MYVRDLSFRGKKIIERFDRLIGKYVCIESMSIDCDGMVRTIRIFFLDYKCLFFQNEFSMDGGELFNRIRDRQDKPFTEREAADIILMIAKAVAHLHHMDMVRKKKHCVFLYLHFLYLSF